MSELGRADAAARERALDVSRSFIVQAPAGSGKTELLSQRFLALLATVEEPESVLAITFTRKAAAEMRGRILGAMREAATPGSTGRKWQKRTLELAARALAADHARDWNLIENPNRLRIQTIDALNLGLARRLPVLSGLGGGLEVMEDSRELYRQAAEGLLQHLPSDEAAHARAVAEVLAHVDNSVKRFVDLVVEMLARRESWLPVLPAGEPDVNVQAELRSLLESARRSLVDGHLQSLHAAFPPELLEQATRLVNEAAANLAEPAEQSALGGCAGVRTAPAPRQRDLACWRALAEFLLTTAGEARKAYNVKLGVPPGPPGKVLKQAALELASALSTRPSLCRDLHAVRKLPDPAYDEEEWRVLHALLTVLRLAAAELELVFADRRVADYPRFARAAREALGTSDAPTDTALALDARLRHVLVDEFQDTSESQVALLLALTAGWQRDDGRTLFLVGDPMQSIYRFRNAEVGLFLEVRDHGLGELELEPLSLGVNFRSSEPLVAWFNAAFTQVLPGQDDALRGAVRFAPSTTAEGAGADGGVRVHPLFRRSRELEAHRVVEIVTGRLSENPDARIAVLVQARSHLVEIVAELTRAGVAFQATDVDPLGERPAVLDLLSVTRALAHPADRAAWLAVLRAPWCGLTLEDLHALAGGMEDAAVIEQLRDPVRLARLPQAAQQRVQRTLRVMQDALDGLRRLGLRDAVERAWIALGGPATLGERRALEETRAYLDELAEISDGRDEPIRLATLAEALEELYAPSPSRPEVRVELMTIHKAKGLQFDTVILPGLDRAPGRDRGRLLHWMKLPEVDGAGLVVAPLAQTGAEANALHAWLGRVEAERLQQERRRLLYVAATRAERWLHLLGSCRLKDDHGSQSLLPPGESLALGMLWPVVRSHYEQRLAESGSIEGEAAPIAARDPPLCRLPLGWQPPQARQGPVIEVRSRRSAGELAPVVFDWATHTARHVGTLVHRELQRIAQGGEFPGPDDLRQRERYDRELAELGVPANLRGEAIERCGSALALAFEDPRGRWLLDGSHRDAASELALSGPLNGELVSVVIDRTFIDSAGTRWVVDYKTSTHEGAALEGFLDSEQQRYREQLERYAELVARLGPEPVKVGLYFPLLRAWREWLPRAGWRDSAEG